jgi:hypothetical protein
LVPKQAGLTELRETLSLPHYEDVTRDTGKRCTGVNSAGSQEQEPLSPGRWGVPSPCSTGRSSPPINLQDPGSKVNVESQR